jgi:hypothetical protein
VLRIFGLREWILTAAVASCLACSATTSGQDAQPSVADAARLARKDKDKSAAPAKTVVTDESLADGAGIKPLATSSASGGTASGTSTVSGKGSLDEAWAKLQATEASLEQMEPLGRADLAMIVLKGNTSDFPNRADWEGRLFSAKQVYVQRSHQIIDAMARLLGDMAALQSGGQGKVAADDPRVQSLTRKAKQLMQIATQTESAFQSVISEGQNLAQQGASR